MCESLISSYLKHIKKCFVIQTNWKITANWNDWDKDNVEKLYDKIKKTEFVECFQKKNGSLQNIDQILKQAEIDVVGINTKDVFMVEVAFHENGLGYKNVHKKVFEKILRAYMCGHAYFPKFNIHIIFATPKTPKTTLTTIEKNLEILKQTFEEDHVSFQFLTNENFKNEILSPTINATKKEADDSQLFVRSYKLLNSLQSM